MMLTNLADIAHRAGLTVVETKGWATRGHGPMRGTNSVIIHHTAGASSGNAPSLGVVTTGRSDLPGPLCHFLIGRDGTAYVIAAGLAYHAGAVRLASWSNAYAIGIEMEGTGTASWPDKQIAAAAKLARALCDQFAIPYTSVLGHKEVCAPVGRKIDPNYDMTAFRNKVKAATNGEDLDVSDDQYNYLKRLGVETQSRVDETKAELADLRTWLQGRLNSNSFDDLAEDRGQTTKLDALKATQDQQTDQLNKIAEAVAKLAGNAG